MKDNFENISLIGKVIREEVNLPVARPAGWHSPIRNTKPGSGRIPFYLKRDFRTYPQRIQDFLRNVFRSFKL